MLELTMYKYLILLLLVSCLERPNSSDVTFSTPDSRRVEREARQAERELQIERERAIFQGKKDEAWNKIVLDAKESFQPIKPMMSKKCFDCHDKNRRLPLYGRIFRRINPVYKHQVDGLKGFDFSEEFPIRANGAENTDNASSQIAFLKALKNSALDRNMPLPSYKLIYRSRKIFNRDEAAIMAWADPIIENLSEFKKVYEADLDDGSMRYQARKIFEAKCFRCHANGKNRGGFGEMEDMDKLATSKYINLENYEDSELYKQVLSGEMPTNIRERLTEEELGHVLEWIREESASQ